MVVMGNQPPKLICCLEEPSAKELLQGILPRLGVDRFQFIIFEGKQDLEKRLQRTLKAWQEPNCIFLILRDKDAGDCHQIKEKLFRLCQPTGKKALIRIACHELESFYLGDLAAVEQGLNLTGISQQQNKKKFREPDHLPNPALELSKLTQGKYQKVLGSRDISPYLSLHGSKSRSFQVLIQGIINFLQLK